MYNYPDKIELSASSSGGGTPGSIDYDGNGDPIFGGGDSGGGEDGGGFEFLSDCRIEENNSYSLSGTYIYSFNVYLPKSFDARKLPKKGATIRLTKKDKTVNEVEATVVDSRSTKFNYVIKT